VQTFDVMVHTAIEPEPFSRSILEGMALGRPIVATRTGGTPEAIEHGVCGLLVPPRDPAAMADAIDSLLRSPALRERLGAAARRRVSERFSIKANVDATERLYRELLDQEPLSSAVPSVAGGGKP
jgi:glycosyltransferase involved in cell wall biosynthesis